MPGYAHEVRTADFTRLYPESFHMTADGTWPSIRRNGLLSAEAVVDRWNVSPQDRAGLLSKRRDESHVLTHKTLGTAVLRDQLPIHEPSLAEVLDDMSVSQWYEQLNSRVFLFPHRSRMLELLSARSYKKDVHTVITIDTAALVDAYEADIELCAINSGFARPHSKARRGSKTFQSIAEFRHPPRVDAHPTRPHVAEITLAYAIRDVSRFVIRVERMRDGELVEVLV